MGVAADLAFVGGPIVTMDASDTHTGALAVADGRIVALGVAARERITPRTQLVDLAGRLLLPGFHDAHTHPLYGGFQQLRCDLTGCVDAAECLRRIDDYAQRQEPGWILGGGWEAGWFPSGSPSRHALDDVTGPRPTMLINQDQHDAWVNSAALRNAGIDRDTPDPRDGWIARDQDGTPTGSLHEGAVDLLNHVVPKGTARDYRDALLCGQRHLQRQGVTSWHDAIVGPYLGYADGFSTYVELDEAELLTGRVRGALWWDRHRGIGQVEELLQRRERARSSRRFRAETVKVMVDGVCENFSAALTEPYRGGHGHGCCFVPADELAEAVTLLDAAGFQVHFHAIGDRAISDALDAVSLARNTNGHNDLRHEIAHVQLVRPEDIPRFRTLGVTATIQPRWAVNDAQMTELTMPYLGPDRAQWQYPFGQLRDAGVTLAAGSDWPVSESDPMAGIHVAVNRQDPDSNAEPFLAREALSLHEALAAYTRGSAWVDHAERRSGSIEPGKAADLVVLSGNPFEKLPDEIAGIDVEMTIVDGRIVHSR